MDRWAWLLGSAVLLAACQAAMVRVSPDEVIG